MIESLRIENLAIVGEAELEFGPGLNVLTGETGAGKSIVLGALALLAGGRATADAVREGCETGTVEAIFRTLDLPELEGDLAARGLEGAEHELLVQRTLVSGGRSRARVAGALVPVSLLADLFRGRIEISSQHDSQALLRPEMHGWLLDRMGGLLQLRAAVGEGARRLRELDEELARLRAAAQERERRRDFLGFQVREIDEAGLDAEELAELRAERGRLAHAERLRQEGSLALAGLAGDPLGGEARGAVDVLADAARRLATLGAIDPALAGFAERLEGLGAEVGEAALELERHLDAIEADPARLAVLDEKLHAVERLQRKYGADVEEVLRFRDAAARELAELEGAEARESGIGGERAQRAARLAEDAKALSEGRHETGGALAAAVEGSLRELGMPRARFEVALHALEPPPGAPCGPGGAEQVEFLFSANAGEAPRSFRRVVSGGELSRAFLALKNALRESARGMVLVFDEVDAGVGGRAADRVGRILSELAGHHQVLCITHLPQIAAFADVHFRVDKAARGGRTRARIQRVEGEARVEEIARMAGGEKVGEATRRHARELLASRRS